MKRNYLNVNMNPCKMCMPMGGALAIKGLEGAINLMHSSQGCSTYIRRHIAQHYNEPMDIASSALTERDTVYGGGLALKQAIKNVIKVYNPKIIGITTSCLAETIGEDLNRIIDSFYKEEDISKDDIFIFNSSTPGYGASQYEGFYSTLRNLLENCVIKSEKTNKLNIVTGMLTPAEIRYIKMILNLWEIDAVILPDISETFDAPIYTDAYKKIAEGGTKLADIQKMSGSIATIEIGKFVKDFYSPGKYLQEKYGVPLHRVAMPIGLKNSDDFLEILKNVSGKAMPKILIQDRGRLLDAMVDSHKYSGAAKTAIFGEPEIVYGITSLCSENGIEPLLVSTGTTIDNYDLSEIYGYSKHKENITVLMDTDFETIQSKVKEKDINILIGHSDGKFVSEKVNLPLLRVGFPIHDRMGAQRQMNILYEGAMNLLDDIVNCTIDKKLTNFRQDMYEQFYGGEKLEGSSKHK